MPPSSFRSLCLCSLPRPPLPASTLCSSDPPITDQPGGLGWGGAAALPAGCQMFPSASVQTESLGTRLLSTGIALRLVLQVLGFIAPEISSHLCPPHLPLGKRPCFPSKCRGGMGQAHKQHPETPTHPILPRPAMSGLSPEMGNIWRSNRQALPQARELLIQARAGPCLPLLPACLPTPLQKEHGGLEKLLLPVATPFTSTAFGGRQSSGHHLRRRLGYWVSRVMLWQPSQ